MSDFLRSALPRSFERLADDLLVGRHADPHVAFAVLVYPDRAPAVIAVTARGSGAHDLTTLKIADKEEASKEDGEGRFFDVADLVDAGEALSDAVMGFRTHSFHRDKNFGMHIWDCIAGGWQRRRDGAMKREMDRIAEEARRPALCEFCNQRYTERGLAQHQTKTRYCARKLAEKQAQSTEAAS